MKRHGAILAVVLFVCGAFTRADEPIKVGLIGLDTSHVTAFTNLLNNSSDPKHVPGAKVVAAWKGGSPDIESSISRVDGYTRELQEKFGVEICETIEDLCNRVDAIILTSVDGRPHLEQVRPVLRAGKPVFIDKPMAGSLRDVIAIFSLAEKAGVPCFSSSSYRYYDSLKSALAQDVGSVRGCISIGPCHLEPHHPDLFWYGVHPTEALFTVLGPECETVARVHTPDTDVVTGTWSNGRTGVLYGLRTGSTPHKVIIFGDKGVAEQEDSGDYANLMREVVQFFRTGKPPVSAQETIALFAFMEAADVSKARNGAPVALAEVIEKARKEAESLVDKAPEH